MTIDQDELTKKLADAFKEDIAGSARKEFVKSMIKSFREGTEPPLVPGAPMPLITPSIRPERENSFRR